MVTASSPVFRFVRGECKKVSLPTPASTAINIGDPIWVNNGVAAIASAFTWTSDLVTTQVAFRKKFLGFSCDNKLASDASTRPITVATTGVWRYPCSALAAAKHIGAQVGCEKDTGNNLLDQTLQVLPAGAVTASMAVLAEEGASGATSVVIELKGFLTELGNAVTV